MTVQVSMKCQHNNTTELSHWIITLNNYKKNIILINITFQEQKIKITDFWSKTLKIPPIWSSLQALTASQLSPKQLLNCVGAAGSKLTPGPQLPAAAKPVKINQPPPQFLTKLLGKTSDQQVSAGLIYRSKFVQGTSTPLALQPKTHAAAARILTEKFSPDKPNPEPPSPRT